MSALTKDSWKKNPAYQETHFADLLPGFLLQIFPIQAVPDSQLLICLFHYKGLKVPGWQPAALLTAPGRSSLWSLLQKRGNLIGLYRSYERYYNYKTNTLFKVTFCDLKSFCIGPPTRQLTLTVTCLKRWYWKINQPLNKWDSFSSLMMKINKPSSTLSKKCLPIRSLRISSKRTLLLYKSKTPVAQGSDYLMLQIATCFSGFTLETADLYYLLIT